MTFSEMEVGKWYWFKHSDHGEQIRKLSFLSDGLVEFDGVVFYKHKITDITPVPSQAEWAALQENYAEKCEQLATVNQHVAEALQLLGVDTSVNGYVPDSWTLREQCKIAGSALTTKDAALEMALERLTDISYPSHKTVNAIDQIRTALQAGKGEG